MKVSLNQFDFYRLNLNNRLVNCQKILLIKRKIFNTLGNLTLIHLLNAKWKEMELNLPKAPLLHKLCSFQKRFCVFDTKSRFSRILVFLPFCFSLQDQRSTRHTGCPFIMLSLVLPTKITAFGLKRTTNGSYICPFSFL